ncbi:SPOSA6832_04659, partial [Sporobolomyces salmonicolor]
MGLITHIVSFKYKDDTSDAQRHLVASSFLALQDQCHLEGNPYLTVTGGKDNSPEGLAKGFQVRSCSFERGPPRRRSPSLRSSQQHAWVVTFETADARDYYTFKDPAHIKFKDLALPFVAEVFVFDFEQGVFCSSRLPPSARHPRSVLSDGRPQKP